MDFFKKGKEKPVETPQPQVRTQYPGQAPANKPAQRDYVVQSGDSLSKIAKQFYGNASDWQKIFEANKDKIKDPNLIHPGQKLIIP